MKKQLLALPFLAVCISSSALAKSPVANIQVSGDIKPPTCSVNGGDNNLVYSFGNISPAIIPQNTTYNSLPILKNNLTVICDAETYLTFKATDAYLSSFSLPPGASNAYMTHVFNLVDTKDESKSIGGVSFTWSKVSVDNDDAYISSAVNPDNVWQNTSQFVTKETINGWTEKQQNNINSDLLILKSGKVFGATFSTYNVINKGIAGSYIKSKTQLSDMNVDINDGINYVGQAILTFNFGV